MLAMLAHKRSWQLRRTQEGKDAQRPNLVIGADVHTCWEKFANHFEVQARVVPMTAERYTIGPDEVEPLIDERTIAVAGVLGTTFTGAMDDLRGINDLLADAQALARELSTIDGLSVMNDGSRFPIVALRAEDPSATDLPALSKLLRERGWIVPAYTLPPDAEQITVLRMVVRESFSRDMAIMLAHDVRAGVKALHQHGGVRRAKPRTRIHC